jgi:hypothetical protein
MDTVLEALLSFLWWLLRATASFLGSLLRAGVEVAVELLFQATGNALFKVLTLGRVTGEAVATPFGSSRPFSIYRQNGVITVGAVYSLLAGLVVWIALLGCIIPAVNRAHFG